MKTHIRIACLIVGGTILCMAIKWALRVYIYDKTYEFPDGLFSGAFLSSMALLGDHRRKKRLRAETREKR